MWHGRRRGRGGGAARAEDLDIGILARGRLDTVDATNRLTRALLAARRFADTRKFRETERLGAFIAAVEAHLQR